MQPPCQTWLCFDAAQILAKTERESIGGGSQRNTPWRKFRRFFVRWQKDDRVLSSERARTKRKGRGRRVFSNWRSACKQPRVTVSTVLLFGLAALHPSEAGSASDSAAGLFPALLGQLRDEFASAEADQYGESPGAADAKSEPSRQRKTDDDGEGEVRSPLGSAIAPLAGSDLFAGPDQKVPVSPSGRPTSTGDSVRVAIEAKVSGDPGQLAPDGIFHRDQGDLSWPHPASPQRALPALDTLAPPLAGCPPGQASFCGGLLRSPLVVDLAKPAQAALRAASPGKGGTPGPFAQEEAFAGASRRGQPETEGGAPEGQPFLTSRGPAPCQWPFAASLPAEDGDAARPSIPEAPAGPQAAEERPWPEETPRSRARASALAERNPIAPPWATISGPAEQQVVADRRQWAAGEGNRLPESPAHVAQPRRYHLEDASSPAPAPAPWGAPFPSQTRRGGPDAAQSLPEPTPDAPKPASAGKTDGGAGFEFALRHPQGQYAEPVATMNTSPPAEESNLTAMVGVRQKPDVPSATDSVVPDEDAEPAATSRFPATRPFSSSSVRFTGGEILDRSRAAPASLPAMLTFGQGRGATVKPCPEPNGGPDQQTRRFPDPAAGAREEIQPAVTGETLERRLPAAQGSPKARGPEGGSAPGANVPSGLGDTGNAEVLRTAEADVPRRGETTHSVAPAREEAPLSGTLARISKPESAAGGSTVHALRVTLADENTGRRVHVHLASAGGDVSLRLSTADPALRRELHDDLPRLAQRLEEAGYRPLPASETDPAPLEQRFRGKGSGDSNGEFQDRDQRPAAGADEHDESGRRRTRQQWMEAFAAAKD